MACILYVMPISSFFIGLQNINTVSEAHFTVTMSLLCQLLTESMSIGSNYKCYRRNINILSN